VGGLAAADWVRSRESKEPRTRARPATDPPRREPSPALVRRLRAEGIAGLLVVVGPDCRVRTISLPGLARSPRAEPSCSLRGPDGRRELSDGSVADCRAGRVRVFLVGAPEQVREVAGCTPAWRPDGTVAFVRDGALRELTVDCVGNCERELLSPSDLRRAAGAEPQIADHVWLSRSRAAVLLTRPGGEHVLGVYEDRRLIASHRWGGGGPARLEVAPGAGLFTARPARVFRRDGTPITLAPRFRAARAVEWSPDGSWAALAMVGAIVLVPTHGLVAGADTRRAIRVPYAARDLAWRGP
jgi:hypothetical protein